MTKLCLVTGVPGVGKTTLCGTLSKRYDKVYEHVSFGQLILEVLRTRFSGISEYDVRQNVTSVVTDQTLKAAVKLLNKRITNGKRTGSQWVVLDSHAVSQDWFGYVATPDGRNYFSKVNYNAIIHLFASPKTVLLRTNAVTTGRQAASERDIELHESALKAVTIMYSSFCECPAYFVDAEKDEISVAEVVDNIIKKLDGTWLSN